MAHVDIVVLAGGCVSSADGSCTSRIQRVCGCFQRTVAFSAQGHAAKREPPRPSTVRVQRCRAEGHLGCLQEDARRGVRSCLRWQAARRQGEGQGSGNRNPEGTLRKDDAAFEVTIQPSDERPLLLRRWAQGAALLEKRIRFQTGQAGRWSVAVGEGPDFSRGGPDTPRRRGPRAFRASWEASHAALGRLRIPPLFLHRDGMPRLPKGRRVGPSA